MDIVIQVAPDRTQASAEQSERRLKAVRRTIAELGLRLEPMHPGSRDPILSNYYYVRAPDPQTATRVIEIVRELPSVSAAYVKPGDKPP